MDKKTFGGIFTALITPFKNNRPDLAGIEKLVVEQLKAKINEMTQNEETKKIGIFKLKIFLILMMNKYKNKL